MRQPKSVYNARYRAKPKGKRAQRRARSRYKRSHRSMSNDYRLTGEERKAMYDKQNGLCGLCQEPVSYESSVLDHKHETGARRSLVHSRCNMLIGWVERFPQLVPAAFAYIAKYNVTS